MGRIKLLLLAHNYINIAASCLNKTKNIFLILSCILLLVLDTK